MSNPSPTEWILARLTTPGRAAAILGDLTEMADTRGRLWFWAAYARTLAVLSWRTVTAVVVGMSLAQLLGNTLFNVMPGPAGPHLPMPLIFWFDPKFLWFVLPFAVVLYGVRDRVVHLTAAAALATTLAFVFLPRFSLAAVVAALALAAAAVLVSGWRKQAVVLAATLAFAFWSAAATGTLSMALRAHGYVPPYGHGILGLEPMLLFRGTMLASACLFARMHNWLIDSPATTAAV